MINILGYVIFLVFLGLFLSPYFVYLGIWFNTRKFLKAHAADISVSSLKSQEVCRRLLDTSGLEHVTILKGSKKTSFYNSKRLSISLGTKFYDKNTEIAIADTVNICGKFLTKIKSGSKARFINNAVGCLDDLTILLIVCLFFKHSLFSDEFIVFLVIFLLIIFGFNSVFKLRRKWLESSCGFNVFKSNFDDIVGSEYKILKKLIFIPFQGEIGSTIFLAETIVLVVLSV